MDFHEVHAACDFFERGDPSVNRGLPRFVFRQSGAAAGWAMHVAGLTMREAYWDDAQAKGAFCDLVREVFAIDFGPWDRAGFWDDEYRPFTYFDGAGRAIASVCLYSMRLVVGGRSCPGGQISGVVTRPEWRRRGLALDLATRALDCSAGRGHAFQYLFADDVAKPLYHRLGFAPVDESLTAVAVSPPGDRIPGARLLNPHSVSDLHLVHRLACEREPVSLEFSALNERLVMYYALVALPGAFWWIEPLGVVVIARRANGVLRIHDVIGHAIPPLGAVYRYLADPSDREIELFFRPDRVGDLRELGSVVERPLLGNSLHVRGAFPLAGPLSVPITAQA